MQIAPVNNNTNFGALKSIRVEGKQFKNHPEIAKELVERIKANKDMMGFFDRWDTNVVLDSRKAYGNQDKASIIFFYKELPTGNKIVDFFRKFKESKHISQDGLGWSFESAIENLKEYFDNGGLISQIHYVNGAADKAAVEKAAKLAAKQEKAAQKAAEARQRTGAQAELDDLIKDMTK